MQIDFYQLSRDPAQKIAVQLAQKLFDAGDRLLIVSADDAQLSAISDALWQADGPCFLAHDRAGKADDALQPILLSMDAVPSNDARHIMIADGQWRAEILAEILAETGAKTGAKTGAETGAETGIQRVFYLFGPAQLDAARVAWRSLKDVPDLTRNFWKQDGGKWVKAA
jgi:DNA polymerase III subunit chi